MEILGTVHPKWLHASGRITNRKQCPESHIG
jgi:hypothetical protein